MATTAPKKINLGMTPGVSLIEEAKASMGSWGKTDLYSTGDPIIDEYLGNSRTGGYGRCVAGDSKIQCRRKGHKSSNNPMSIESLYKTIKGIDGPNIRGKGDKFEVLAVDPGTEKMVWADIEDVFDNGEKECFEVTVKNKYGRTERLVCTKEHMLYVPGMRFVPLERLQPGDKVCMRPKGKECSTLQLGRKSRCRYLTYEIHAESGIRYRDLLHRMVYTAHMNNISLEELMYRISKDEIPEWSIPDGYDVHHVNGDKLDNRIENLELLTTSDHSRIHAAENNRSRKSWVEGTIMSIEPVGKKHVYDMRTSLGSYNADGIIVHNCGGYEIVTIYGSTGCSKSTFATSMILDPAEKGVPIAYFALEDDPKDVVQRILIQCDMDEEKAKRILKNIMFMPESDGYTLDAMAKAIEEIFSVADIVVVDPLQMIFESSVEERGETEFNRQRLFMRKMNNVMKHTGKTLIIVSHTAKKGGKNDTKSGVDRIIGSSAVAQVSTKCIEIDRKEDGLHGIRMWKSRFTPYRFCGLQIRLDNMKIRTVYSPDDLPQARMNWEGRSI